MAYSHKKIDNRSDTINGIVNMLFTVLILFSIGDYIKKNFFIEANKGLYWVIYVLSFGVLIYSVSGTIFLITGISKKLKLKIANFKLQHTYCKHGIKGGETLERCRECKNEKEKAQQESDLRAKEASKKVILRQQVVELRNEEILRFTKMNLGSNEFLYNVTPNEFEDVIAEMYRKNGYQVKQTPYSNDKGKDIILKKDGNKYLVECKRYDLTNTIGREALQKFFAAIIEEKADKGFFVTTSDFRRTAIQYAKDIGKIELINGNRLVLMMRETYPEKYNSNLIKIMCRECGDIIEFTFRSNLPKKLCANGHLVENDFDSEILSPKYLINKKYCVKCAKPMKLVAWKNKHLWRCSDYPKCRSHQMFITAK